MRDNEHPQDQLGVLMAYWQFKATSATQLVFSSHSSPPLPSPPPYRAYLGSRDQMDILDSQD